MIIRTGILHISQLDETASELITEKLHDTVPMIFILLENHVDSQKNWIEHTLEQWCDEEELDLIITIGGTLPASGPSNQEIVPEATASVIERSLPGISEAMRRHAQIETPLALLDRSIAGIRGRTFILNLPSGAAPALLFLEPVANLIQPIIAHLQPISTAPQLSDKLEITRHSEQGKESQPESNIAIPSEITTSTRKLDPAEFAAFLRRGEIDA